MMTGWRMDSASRSAVVRAMRSSAPPAAVVTTSWMGLDGYSCARVGALQMISPMHKADEAMTAGPYPANFLRMSCELHKSRRDKL